MVTVLWHIPSFYTKTALLGSVALSLTYRNPTILLRER